MKTRLLTPFVLIVFLAGFFPVGSEANAEDTKRLRENLVLQFVMEEKGQTVVDFQLLIAQLDFSIDHIIADEPELNVSVLRFQGTLEEFGEDDFYLNYVFRRSLPIVTGQDDGRRQVSFRDIGWNSTARLQLGKEVILLKDRDREHRVLLFRETDRPLPEPEEGSGE